MAKYASGTTVSEAATMAEIERLLTRYKADGFGFGRDNGKAAIWFRFKARSVRFIVKLPDKNEKRFTHGGRRGWQRRTEEAANKAHGDECKRLWRCLLAVIKAKFVAVTDGVAEFDTEFMPYICMPDGRTFGEAIAPQIQPMLDSGQCNIPLLPGAVESETEVEVSHAE